MRVSVSAVWVAYVAPSEAVVAGLLRASRSRFGRRAVVVPPRCPLALGPGLGSLLGSPSVPAGALLRLAARLALCRALSRSGRRVRFAVSGATERLSSSTFSGACTPGLAVFPWWLLVRSACGARVGGGPLGGVSARWPQPRPALWPLALVVRALPPSRSLRVFRPRHVWPRSGPPGCPLPRLRRASARGLPARLVRRVSSPRYLQVLVLA